jgi:aarF domain-containing kinase
MKLVKLSLLSSALFGGLYYSFPLFRENPREFASSSRRFLRMSTTAAQIAFNYSLRGVSSETHAHNANLLFETLKINGGIFIKLGQVLALLDLVIPNEYCDVMKPMLNQAPVSAFSSVKEVIECELHSDLSTVFVEFEEQPIASASLAQVHRARLRTGEEVAVKVQHKWVRSQFPGDIKLLEVLAKLGKRIFPSFDYLWIIQDLKKSSREELDFVAEARNAQRCFKIFEKDEQVLVPKMYLEHSSGRVLTMELMTGVKVNEVEEIKAMGLDLKDVAYTLSRAFNEMIFVHGFIHCDPHPGNIFVRKVRIGMRNRAQIVLLDHGLYRELSKKQLHSYREMWRAIINQDEKAMKKAASELGINSMYPLLAGMMVGRAWDDIMDNSLGLERLRNARAYHDEKEALKTHAKQWHKEINHILGKIDNEIVLLFKTFEWLRANDAALGAPINTIGIIAQYVTVQDSFWKRFWLRLKLWLYRTFYVN